MAVLNVQPKPLNFQAIQWTGENLEEVKLFIKSSDLGQAYLRPNEKWVPTLEFFDDEGVEWGIEVGDYIVAFPIPYHEKAYEVLNSDDFHSKYRVA